MRRDRDFRRELQSRGWTVTFRKNGHIKAVLGDRHILYLGASISDIRGFKNARAHIRRCERNNCQCVNHGK